ncbi:glycoside hydrolase family 78 protein [Streptomyces sp. NBC_00006]|uniref:glycoside hydrolase family 78 protein n=1 Tax=unclassified Streptomyces TaxID=2593676 RepID=UPI0022555DF2|nr:MULTISPECIES: glycoside hydrolase family 78 protein [unclassified Streptomyces]MCX5537038.1 glycoside hydrolase family 78 protein [Streptomyces sp. NBC_00006]
MGRVTAPVFEHHREALGIGEAAPRLSWRTETDEPDWTQLAYQITVIGDDGDLVADTGRVDSPDSVLVDWPGPALTSRQRATARVRVWGGSDGAGTDWSPPATVEAGLLTRADWHARPVTPDREPPDGPLPVALLRRAFTVDGPVRSARLYTTAYGVYETEINGTRVGDDVLAPGWTSYRHRLRYRTHDVTGLLRRGENALGALLGEGWYTGRLGWDGGRRARYGPHRALLAQLEIRYADGRTHTVATDPDWHWTTGPLLRSELYDGEEYDARRERDGWSGPGHGDRDWQPVQELPFPAAELVAPNGPPVRRVRTVPVRAVHTTPSGRTVVDFGENVVGRLRIRVTGPAGHTVTLRHAEVLDGGELARRPLRDAAATDTYVLRGTVSPETYEPRFTCHGFRYAEIDGWPGEFDPACVAAVVIRTDLRRTGWFRCSDPLIDRLHDNVLASLHGNFLDLPTDCPQRDERLGWTGDIAVFAPTAAFLYDCTGMLGGWLRDLAAEQFARPDRSVPLVVPDILDPPMADGVHALWGDAAVLVPWALYRASGDIEVLRAQYPSMAAWLALGAARADAGGGVWRDPGQLGDWLDPAAPPDDPAAARTDADLVACAYLVHSADLVAEAAELLDEKDDAHRHRELAARLRTAFAAEFVTPAGRLSSDSQTAYTLALSFGLLPSADQRHTAARRLAHLVRRSGFRIATGFAGTPLICDALCSVGEHRLAHRMLAERHCPSWLYPVTMGATTIWERWDSLLPDGTVNPGQMTSFNHYALGSVADWLHRTVAGLAPAEPGWRRIRVAPRPGGTLTHAWAAHLTPYGRAESGWRLDGGTLTVDVRVPPGVRAEIALPGGDTTLERGAGRHGFTIPYDVPPRPVTEIGHPLVPREPCDCGTAAPMPPTPATTGRPPGEPQPHHAS